mgnify:FL=1
MKTSKKDPPDLGYPAGGEEGTCGCAAAPHSTSRPKERQAWRFRGPVWPVVGPDWNEPLDQFDPCFLARECARDPRVREYLRSRELGYLIQELEALQSRLTKVEAALKRALKQERPWLSAYGGGVPL